MHAAFIGTMLYLFLTGVDVSRSGWGNYCFWEEEKKKTLKENAFLCTVDVSFLAIQE